MQNSSLTEDVTVEILSRLPVKDLLRFKCVCTQWHKLISSRFLANLHLNRSISNRTRHSILVHQLGHGFKHRPLDPLEPLAVSRSEGLDVAGVYVASINGLICVLGRSFDGFMIWNPATGMFKTLPPGRHTDPSWLSIGFGWDSIADDYKLVKIGANNEDGELGRVWSEVWSANSDTWRAVRVDRNFDVRINHCDVVVKGFAYWLAEDGFVATFDMRTEVLQLVPIPQSLLGQRDDMYGMNWKENFALIALVSTEPRNAYQVWMMEDDTARTGRWSKKFTFSPDIEFCQFVHGVSGRFCQFVYGTSGKFVQRRHRQLFLYDVEARDIKKLGRIRYTVNGAYFHVESLVSIKGFNQLAEDAILRWNEKEQEQYAGVPYLNDEFVE